MERDSSLLPYARRSPSPPVDASFAQTATTSVSFTTATSASEAAGGCCSEDGMCGCLPAPGGWRYTLGEVAYSDTIGNVSTALVVVNVILMCMPYAGQSAEYEAELERWSTLVSWLFIIEMAMKQVGRGCATYWADGWNQLDGCIVIMSIVEMLLTAIFAGSGVKLSFLRILRMLRIARMLRLMKSWKGLYKIISTVVQAMPQLSNVLILMFLIDLIFALLGMQIFGGKFHKSNGYEPLPGVDLPLPGYEDYPLLGEDDSGGGRMLKGTAHVAGASMPLPRYNFDYFVPAIISVFILTTGNWFTPMIDGVKVAGEPAALYYIIVMGIGTYIVVNLFVAILLQLFSTDEDGDGKADAFDMSDGPPAAAPSSSDDTCALDDDGMVIDESEDMALCCLGPRSSLRSQCRAFITDDTVETALMIAVIVSSGLLIIDNPRLEEGSSLASDISLANSLFTVLFTVEAAIKIVGYGFYWTRDGYLKSGWNKLDFSLLLVSIGSILSSVLPQLSFLKSFRAFRALRPLRLLSRNEGMRLIIETLGEALPAVANVFGVVLALQLVFAILGMQMFSGTFATCSDPAVLLREDCVGVLGDPPSSPPSSPAPSYMNFTYGEVMREVLRSSGQGNRSYIPQMDTGGSNRSFAEVVQAPPGTALPPLGPLPLAALQPAFTPSPTPLTQPGAPLSPPPAFVTARPTPVPVPDTVPVTQPAAQSAAAQATAAVFSADAAWLALSSRASFRQGLAAVHSTEDLQSFLDRVGAQSLEDLRTVHQHPVAFTALLEQTWGSATDDKVKRRLSSQRRRVPGRMLKGGGAGGEEAGGEREWSNPPFGSFDDFGQAMLLLIVMSSGDNWDSVMFYAMDNAADVGQPRIRNDSSAASLFFIFWMFVGSFFAMQLFVGVVVDQFNTIKAQKDGSATMTPSQAAWVETMKALGNAAGKGRPRVPTTTGTEGAIDLMLYNWITSKHFTPSMLFLVVVNVIVLASDYWGLTNDPIREVQFEAALHSFSILFYVEAAVKLRIYGKTFYFRDPWCKFEQKLVLLSLVEQSHVLFLISDNVVALPDTVLRAPSALVTLRILRVVQIAKALEKLTTIALMSLPSLVNVTSLLILVIFIYSILGVQLFTFLPRGVYIDDDRNFDTFQNALLVNLQCLTGDSWSTLMSEARDSGDADPIIVQAFFVSFQVIGSYVILNLLVAVILENFAAMGAGNSDLISSDDIETFSETWADFDPDASQLIPAKVLPDLLKAIPQPMGLQGGPRTWVLKVCINLGLSPSKPDLQTVNVTAPRRASVAFTMDREPLLGFRDTLQALVRFNFMMQSTEPVPGGDDDEEDQEGDELEEGVYKPSKTSILWGGGKVTVAQRELAKLYSLELLSLSSGTKRLRACIDLPRGERKGYREQYVKDRELAILQQQRLEKEAKHLIVGILKRDAAKAMELFRSWDEDGDGEVSHSEFQKAMPKLGIIAKYNEVKAVFKSWDLDGVGTLSIDELESILAGCADDGTPSPARTPARTPSPARNSSPALFKTEAPKQASLDASTAVGAEAVNGKTATPPSTTGSSCLGMPPSSQAQQPPHVAAAVHAPSPLAPPPPPPPPPPALPAVIEASGQGQNMHENPRPMPPTYAPAPSTLEGNGKLPFNPARAAKWANSAEPDVLATVPLKSPLAAKSLARAQSPALAKSPAHAQSPPRESDPVNPPIQHFKAGAPASAALRPVPMASGAVRLPASIAEHTLSATALPGATTPNGSGAAAGRTALAGSHHAAPQDDFLERLARAEKNGK